jgi:uncharacterized membrane protein|tara:strand:+ start:490 stop:1041 length:552 start_codon:yes stop_codon:yes gene_type:complete
MKNLINYFLQGLLYIVPISVTIYVVIWSFNKIDGILPFDIPGIGLIVLFALITLIGMLGAKLIASPFNSLFNKVLEKAPLLKTIYSSVKDLMKTFVGGKKGFDQAVLVKIYENSTIERMGFITNEDLKNLNISEGKVLVYLPHSYAFSGQLFVVEKKFLTPINSSSSDIMKLIVSGGVSEIEN